MAPSRRTMGVMKAVPVRVTSSPKPTAMMKAVDRTLLAFSSFRAPRSRAI